MVLSSMHGAASLATLNRQFSVFSDGFRLYSTPSADLIENSVGLPYGILIAVAF
uniref:Uncharacterized protein n=1 Tax=Arundo donax TaxID=35708 RepID=A0A0A9HFV0_ARUDO